MARGATGLSAFPLAALLLAGCASTPAPPADPGPDRQITAAIVAKVAAQVRRCYRMPRVPREGRDITIVLAVRYAPDGTLSGFPQVAAQRGVTPENQPYAGRMAEAAIRAVLECTPISMPPEQYQGGWDDFELTFSPRARA